ncbi:MAG TPA: ABC transporter ATP-binding protein [Candidatus Thermoplasmatota archaeon]|nr:ABC transporter ATP-binding protein [Candidatus Thermoplasmatota archaeon]
MPEPAIRAQALVRTFDRKPEQGMGAAIKRLVGRGPPKGTITAVDHVDLEVARGEFFGLLGPNGAGKTTLVKLLSTLLLPSSGTAEVAGLDVVKDADAVRRKVGVVLGGERALYWRLTGRENLWYFSQLYDMPAKDARRRIDALLDVVDLADRADERVENYSKGMKQRLHVARGLLNDPDVLLLDEPSIGLDPHAARSVRALVKDLTTKHGKTVVLTTHYMYEADQLSDRVAIMSRGRILAVGTPTELKERYGGAHALVVEVARAGDALAARLGEVPGVARATEAGHDPARGVSRFRLLPVEGATENGLAAAVAETVKRAGASLIEYRIDRPTLEDAFVRATGETLE